MATEQPGFGVSSTALRIWFQMSGSVSAPGLARRQVLRELDDAISPGLAIDVSLVVSELVTNSVRHTRVGTGVIAVEILVLADVLRLTVTDGGGETVPRLLERDPERPSGFGLFLVNALSSVWGVEHEPMGAVRVWCEIPLSEKQRD